MKEETKRAKLAELFGLEAPTATNAQVTNERQTTSREAEAALAYYENASAFQEKMCTYCERVFAVNRGNVSYCSDACRAKALADIGIAWDASKAAEERWALSQGSKKSAEPLTVPPAALELLKPLAETQTVIAQEVNTTEEVPLWESVLADLE